jgi:hypothetical protein
MYVSESLRGKLEMAASWGGLKAYLFNKPTPQAWPSLSRI